jgi:cytidine deaminase
MNSIPESQLVELACQVRCHAYAPHSGLQVGAALEAGGRVFTGCNVENASFGLTMCAERVAVFNAVASGFRDFESLVLASPNGLPPCGACRQVLAEFCEELPILLVAVERENAIVRSNLSTLLPDRFEFPT